MNGEHDIEQALRGLRWSIPAELDRKVLSDGLNAFDEVSAISLPRAIRFRRRTWLKIIAAGATAAAAVLAFVVFSGQPSLTLADVQAAFEKQSWVHLKYDNGQESWLSLRNGNSYLRGENGRIVFIDQVKNIRHSYHTGAQYISEDVLLSHRISGLPPWTPTTAWEQTIGWYEKFISPNEPNSSGRARREISVERHAETVNGRKLARFDVYWTDALDRRLLTRQLWADPVTRLPVRMRERLQSGQRAEQGREWITGVYDFPSKGPSSVYELGVPQDVTVWRAKPTTLPDAAKSAIEAAAQARNRWPERWRLIVWSDKHTESGVELVYWSGRAKPRPPRSPDYSGVKARQEHYFNMGLAHSDYHLPTPTTADHVLAWTGTQTPVGLSICDGKKCYSKSGPFPPMISNPGKLQVTVRTLDQGPSLSDSFWPSSYQWPEFYPTEPYEMVENSPDCLPDTIMIRWNMPGRAMDYCLDPLHDYICVKNIWWREKSGRLEKEREYQNYYMERLPTGQWYARKQRLLTDFEGSRRPYERVFNIDVKVLAENDFPPEAFNAQKLLDDAKKQGAKIETY